jgi:hypothetical protein
MHLMPGNVLTPSVMIFLTHSLIRAQVEDIRHLDYLLLDKKVRANRLLLNVIFIFNNEVYLMALYYL